MRLEGKIKMGYYPTPNTVTQKIKTFIKYQKELTSFLDPCCGEGNALSQLVKNENSITYGIEPDKHRADEAEQKLDKIINCGYEETRISNKSFSCLFLNPPYDWETTDTGDNEVSQRKEKTFLMNTTKYLNPDGLLIYIIPFHRLRKDIVKFISYRFYNIKIFKFPGDEYDIFKQIVLFGVKKKKNDTDGKLLVKLLNLTLSENSLNELPYLDRPQYTLPETKTINLFRSTRLNEETLTVEVKSSLLWDKLKDLSCKPVQRLKRPILDLHKGHLGLLLANGCLDGIVGNGHDRHIVRGKVEKHTVKVEEIKGNVVELREMDKYKISIKLLMQDGEMKMLM